MVGEIPDIKKAVFIAAPHTSNWDGFWMIVFKFAIDVKIRFLGKHTLFWWPLGPILSAMGCMPVDRTKATDIVEQLIDAFEREDHLFLALAPEGTRKKMPHWKSGFYRIAKTAEVPMVFVFIDYHDKRLGIGPTLPVGQTYEQDLLMIREFYSPLRGRHPELQGPIEFSP